MTPRQITKLHAISPVLNFYENAAGELIVETTYGTKYYCRLFIGSRGGFSGRTIVYGAYDFETRKPYKKLYDEEP